MSNTIYTKEERKQIKNEILDKCRISPNENFNLSDHSTKWEGYEGLESLGDKNIKAKAKAHLKKNLGAMSKAQELLYASNKKSLLLVFQAMDAAGKDSTIKHVISGVNPQGCEVNSFKKPSSEEASHSWLWRYMKKMPSKGMIGIFNRSYFEEVLVVKVHPELLGDQYDPNQGVNSLLWESRYEDINNMEKHLSKSGTVILKFFLNVSKEEQRNRFLERLENSEKHWKFSASDLVERECWPSYMDAFESAINATSTDYAPWHVIPADNKWVMRSIVSQIITESILSLDLEYPKVPAEKKQILEQAKQKLLNE